MLGFIIILFQSNEIVEGCSQTEAKCISLHNASNCWIDRKQTNRLKAFCPSVSLQVKICYAASLHLPAVDVYTSRLSANCCAP